MKPALEQLKAWVLEASREPGFGPIENVEEELAGIPDEELMAVLFVCTKATAWAREQALEEAAKKCLEAAAQYRIAYNGPGEPFGAPPLEAMADAIRALKEPKK